MAIKQINHITLLSHYCLGSDFIISIETALPSDPHLFTTCKQVQDYLLKKDTQGTVVPHGIKKWIPQLQDVIDPLICDRNRALFVNTCDCDPGVDGNWFIAELGQTPPTIEWDSLLHPCACDTTPDEVALGSFFLHEFAATGTWQSFGWNVNVPPTTLPNNLTTFNLPSHGSFGVSAAVTWKRVNYDMTPQMRVVVSGSPNSPFTTEPYAPTGRPCQGTMMLVPRQRITGAGWTVHCEAMDGPQFNAFWALQSPCSLLISWFDD